MTRILMAEATDFRGPMQVGSHALARQFAAAGASVMWLGTPLYAHTLVRRRDPGTRHRFEVWRCNGVTRDSITEYYPLTLLPVMNRPLLRSRGAAMHTLRATVPPVGGIIRRHGFDRPDVLWLSASRFSFPMLSMVQAAKKAYRMSDDWAAFPEVPRALIDLEAKILDTVDAVFVTGRSLEERVRARRPDVVYLPNGVDDVFFRGRTTDDPVVASYPRPRVVFAGTLGDWVDFDAIAAAARRSPQASFLLVGAGRAAEKRAFPANVYRVGAVAYEQLPAVIAACHVGIVPFRRTPRTEAASSNKVLQYLACGLPVVCSRTKEIEQAGAPVAICDHAEQFAEAVADALQHGDEHRAARSDFARRHTWKQRADVVRATLGF